MTINVGVQVSLESPDSFLKCKETLTRIGIASRTDNKLYQSCHLLHKRGMYYIVHFKELFMLDGKESNLSDEDIQRRNLIASLLNDWGLLSVLDINTISNKAPMTSIKVLPYGEKNKWTLVEKYRIGAKKYDHR